MKLRLILHFTRSASSWRTNSSLRPIRFITAAAFTSRPADSSCREFRTSPMACSACFKVDGRRVFGVILLARLQSGESLKAGPMGDPNQILMTQVHYARHHNTGLA